MFKTNPLASAIRSATLATALAATGVPVAFAQSDSEILDEVIVTGSRIARDPLSTTGPITIVDSAAISRSGVGTIDELLNQLPSMGTTGINANDNNGGVGLSFVDLRNLGSARTLVLVNGRRFVSSASGVSSAVDMNNIPVDMIERIEVLTDGASAIYGSDAVAGVINVVMKDSFEGVRINARAGTTSEGGGENGELSLSFGTGGERGHFTGNITHSQRDEIKYDDRDWAGLTSSLTPEGNIFTNYGSFGVDPDDLSLGAATSHDIGQYMWLSGAMERTSLTFSGNYALTDDVEFYGEAAYTTKATNQQLAAQPMYAANGLELDPTLHLQPEIQSQLQDAWQDAYDDWVAAGSDPEDSENPYPGADWIEGYHAGGLYTRPVAGGPRASEQETDTFRFVAGLRGDLANGWSWDAFANYGKNEGENTNDGNYSKTAMEEILDGSAGIAPVFAGGWSDEVINHMRYVDREDNEYELQNYGVSLTGDIDAVQMQGGALGFAAGIEYRKESGEFNPSPETQSGATFGNQQEATSGDYSVTETFAEFSLPIFAGAAFAEELTADVALRYSDFDTFGGESTGKIGLVYAPVQDLRFRTTMSTSFRAPGIYELYSGTAQSYEYLVDPCDTTAVNNPEGRGDHCPTGPAFVQAGSQVPTNIGGNPDLGPEEADTFTFGLVWTPAFTEDLSVTLDYYDIEVESAITSPDLQMILDDCYRNGLASACSSITRGGTSGNGQITNLEGAKMNIGQVDTRGVDLAVAKNMRFDAGNLALNLKASRLLDYTEFNEQTGQESDYLGYVGTNSEMFVEWRGLASAMWFGSNWEVGLETEYFDSGETPYVEADSKTYLNLRGGWDVNDAFRLTAGLDNVGDEEPQDMGLSSWNSFYDFKGRYYWAGATYQF
ncbi:TonB-dependent receptor plug domain-containing protein [Gilvimarinus sp. F26214L]|uniref:TonB-dependent receptor plug domain-containing protein n=1 Tax=Gilvimarinus sp. DZF01 TaxID=3461371 RepID=UPI004045FBD5